MGKNNVSYYMGDEKEWDMFFDCISNLLLISIFVSLYVLPIEFLIIFFISDLVANKGAEAVNAATLKTQEINKAFEVVKKYRNL